MGEVTMGALSPLEMLSMHPRCRRSLQVTNAQCPLPRLAATWAFSGQHISARTRVRTWEGRVARCKVLGTLNSCNKCSINWYTAVFRALASARVWQDVEEGC